MTDNSNPEAAWTYHDATKHSYSSVRSNPNFLDWANQPFPFKTYPTLEPLSLPREMRQSGIAALSAIAGGIPASINTVPDLQTIAQLFYLSAGITRQRKYPGGELYFRAAACTGALYEVELYLVCANLADLEAGIYHFAPAEFALRRLRTGDYRRLLLEATGGQPSIAQAPLTVCVHLHLLAQCLEVSGPHLPSFRLGQRYFARQLFGYRDRSGAASQCSVGLCGREYQSTAGSRCPTRSGVFAGGHWSRAGVPVTIYARDPTTRARDCPAFPMRG